MDTAAGRIVEDDEVKAELAAEHPYAEWLHQGLVRFEELPRREREVPTHETLVRRQQTFGYTLEEQRIILTPMAKNGAEPIGSMGTDTPIAVLSERPRLLFDYFKQLFAQVTNPPLDAIREELVAIAVHAGPGGQPRPARPPAPPPAAARSWTTTSCPRSSTSTTRVAAARAGPRRAGPVRGVRRGEALEARLEEINSEVSRAIAVPRIIVLSDRGADSPARRSRRCCSPGPSTTT